MARGFSASETRGIFGDGSFNTDRSAGYVKPSAKEQDMRDSISGMIREGQFGDIRVNSRHIAEVAKWALEIQKMAEKEKKGDAYVQSQVQQYIKDNIGASEGKVTKKYVGVTGDVGVASRKTEKGFGAAESKRDNNPMVIASRLTKVLSKLPSQPGVDYGNALRVLQSEGVLRVKDFLDFDDAARRQVLLAINDGVNDFNKNGGNSDEFTRAEQDADRSQRIRESVIDVLKEIQKNQGKK